MSTGLELGFAAIRMLAGYMQAIQSGQVAGRGDPLGNELYALLAQRTDPQLVSTLEQHPADPVLQEQVARSLAGPLDQDPAYAAEVRRVMEQIRTAPPAPAMPGPPPPLPLAGPHTKRNLIIGGVGFVLLCAAGIFAFSVFSGGPKEEIEDTTKSFISRAAGDDPASACELVIVSQREDCVDDLGDEEPDSALTKFILNEMKSGKITVVVDKTRGRATVRVKPQLSDADKARVTALSTAEGRSWDNDDTVRFERGFSLEFQKEDGKWLLSDSDMSD